MTTCVYSTLLKTAAADTQNTDGADQKWRVNKIEHLSNGGVFLGSGHCRTIQQAKQWAEVGFAQDSEPDWSYYLEAPEDRDFQCIFVEAGGTVVWMIDGELSPMRVIDDYVAVGSGAAYALGAMDAGADPVRAVEIAAERDPSTSAPIHTYTFEEP
jgi:hypothetical protein